MNELFDLLGKVLFLDFNTFAHFKVVTTTYTNLCGIGIDRLTGGS